MLSIERFDSTCLLSDTPPHYDLLAFPRHVNWFCLLEKHVLQPGTKVLVYRAKDTNDTNCTLIAMVRECPGALRLKRLSALQNFYTPDFRPLCSSKAAVTSINSLVTQMLTDDPPDVISFLPLDAHSLETQELQKALTWCGYILDARPYLVNWIHDVEGDYEHYISTRPKRVQNTLIRRTRKLQAMQDVHIEISDGSQDLPRLLGWYDVVYSRSWKVPEPHPHFISALITQSAASDQLRLGFISIAGRPIAMHFWVISDQCAFIYKLAHDKEFDKLSPGSVLMAQMLKQVIDADGVTRIDFLTGDDAYKQDWMSQRRTKIELRAYNRSSVRGKALSIVELHLKPFVKQFRNRFHRARNHPRFAAD